MLPMGELAKSGTPQTYRIDLSGHDKSITAHADQSVLQTLIAAAVAVIPVGCRGGGCGICRIKVVSGRYRTKVMSRSRISEDDERDGIVLACRVFPESDLSIVSLPLGKRKTPTS
jgi:ferredoxin